MPPPSDAPAKTIAPLGIADLARWLRLAASDMAAHPGISGFYGMAFWIMAVVLGAVFKAKPEYTMSIASGCLLVGPFLAMGLYEVSRRRESGGTPDLGSSLTCWDSHIRSMGMLVLALVVFAVFFNTGMPSTTGVIQAVFNPENWEFLVAYAVVGAGFAALVFSIAVVSIPMILDRDTDAVFAAITSLEVVFHNTAAMIVWGVCITALVAMALLTPWAIGLLVVGPLLGHASWHAYRGAVRWPADSVETSLTSQAS
ncbi:MAG: hypothetical protein CFE44_26115 [Burkholderiales bacterium PBB4]|nr:MAG: hypothetical protein CFE44_26115 [Burkholderiales bacterium PBB4]